MKQWFKYLGRVAPLPGEFVEKATFGGVAIELATFTDAPMARARLATQWRRLEAESDGGFFLTWAWMESWLEEIVEGRSLLQATLTESGQIVGLALIAILERRVVGRLSRVAFFHELPIPGSDMTIEKNGCLCKSGEESRLFGLLIDALGASSLKIDEMQCRAIDERYLGGWNRAGFYPPAYDKQAPCWLVGKKESDESLGLQGLMDSLSKNRRWQINRFIRLATERYGPLTVSVAKTGQEAQAYFQAMGDLHTIYWQAQGLPGVFANRRWQHFHQALIEKLLPKGSVQLARVTAGEQDVGFLYNVAWRKEVSNIQCGFKYLPDNRWRPGYASHLLAAAAAGEEGYRYYDLLMGDDEYKRSIARPGRQLVWLSLFARRRLNPRYMLWLMLEAYRWVRMSSKPKAQGDSRSRETG